MDNIEYGFKNLKHKKLHYIYSTWNRKTKKPVLPEYEPINIAINELVDYVKELNKRIEVLENGYTKTKRAD